MIVEPAPTGPRGRGARVLRAAALVVPLVLLGAAVAIGIAGPRAAPLPVATPFAADADVAAPSPAEEAPPPGAPASFPTVAADLEVRTLADVAARIDAIEPGPFAVAGYLGSVRPDPPCEAAAGDTRGDLGPLCLREARLEAAPDDSQLGFHLHLVVPAGARLPPAFERAGGPGRLVPVVLVGHPGPRPVPCRPTVEDCRGEFVVERVTWADGEPFDPGPVFDAGLEVAPPGIAFRNLDSAETLAIGWDGTILMATLIRPSSVAAVDEDAAAMMRAAPEPETLVWYVRGLETGYDPQRHLHGSAPPRYSWVVLDYETGATLARGPVRTVSP